MKEKPSFTSSTALDVDDVASGHRRVVERSRAMRVVSSFKAAVRQSGSSKMAAVLAVLSLAACSLPQAQPDLTRYFLLNEVTHEAAVAEVVGEPPRIVLRPVIVPEYLRGRIMQVRVGDNELRFIDEARWAEPLEAGLTRVLREDLAQRPSRVRVVARGGDEHEFDVAVNLRRCEGVLPAGLARLAARIEIFSMGVNPELVAQEDFTLDVPGWDGSDYGELAKKLSQAADALTERIVVLLPAVKS
jgi:uncharacterized lipoprotein YmbA